MSFYSASPDPTVNRQIETTGYAAAALTLLPLPGTEIIGVVPLHVAMVIGVANHYGRSLDEETATELLMEIGATVGLSLVGSRLAMTTAKFVLPGLGGLVAAPFMFASTVGLGAVADAWFRQGALSEAEMKNIYNQTRRSAKKGFQPEKAKKAAQQEEGSSDPVERLKRARDLLQRGLISQAEFDALKRDVLAAI